ncbi:MAG: 5-oxoprolinase (ATP-hydrolysing)/N-methylhydantoinase A [Chloroflexi bacterium]|jgi:N-methylhydantoinase A/oxoprolinase/acetone carboxylase beta subunit|nr:MAG: 5-oxoprolinase (ATP-hydrolysing)/N-methylhydantoinase A [Chloroflexota bacterium]
MINRTGEFKHILSVDIGGTFTDFSLLDLNTGKVSVNKVLTDADQPEEALISGASELLERIGVGYNELRLVVHSTTLATNAIIERKGAKTGLITTDGFRDILELRREQIYDMYDLQARYPEPLAPRYLRQGIRERTDSNGLILERVAEDDAVKLVDGLLDEGAEALAIALMHAYKNPANEEALKAVIENHFPDVTVSISSEVAPVINEYERTSTTIADCYIKPSVSKYLAGVRDRLSGLGYTGELLVMHSAGGVIGSDAASQRPVRLLESGPAAGALAASFYGTLLSKPDLVSIDMGGTTAKTCVIEGGKPAITNSIEVARIHRFKVGSGLPIMIPVLDLIEIGSGGGSIAWTDSLGLLKVGPHSAGAKPGPACYGLGGTIPTVTDANLLLGYLNPNYFLGGKMQLDINAARRAVSALAQTLGISEVQVAWGIYSVVTENMAASARLHIIGRNKDPRNYSIIAFGGAGPAHACDVARILGATEVIVPLAAGVTSALGCLTAPLSLEDVRSLPGSLADFNAEDVNNIFRNMEASGLKLMNQAGVPEEHVELVRSADMRLKGQIHEINVPVSPGELNPSNIEQIESDFHAIYQEFYSRRNLNIPIEVQNWRLLARGPEPIVNLREEAVTDNVDLTGALKGTRKAYFRDSGGYVDCPIYDRYKLTAGSRIEGPAIIEEQDSTAVMSPRDSVLIDRWLNLVFKIG